MTFYGLISMHHKYHHICCWKAIDLNHKSFNNIAWIICVWWMNKYYKSHQSYTFCLYFTVCYILADYILWYGSLQDDYTLTSVLTGPLPLDPFPMFWLVLNAILISVTKLLTKHCQSVSSVQEPITWECLANMTYLYSDKLISFLGTPHKLTSHNSA